MKNILLILTFLYVTLCNGQTARPLYSGEGSSTGNNGLSTVGNNIKLGGTLTENTNINGLFNLNLLQGKLGIGLSNPFSNLHLHTPSANGSFIQVSNSTTGLAAALGLRFGVSSSGDSEFHSMTPSSSILFKINGSDRANINSLGYFGINTILQNSTFQVNGSVSYSIKTTIVNVALTNNDKTLILLNGGVAITVNLPAANTCVGREYEIVNKSGFICITSVSYQNMTNTGVTQIPIGSSFILQSDGNLWQQK